MTNFIRGKIILQKIGVTCHVHVQSIYYSKKNLPVMSYVHDEIRTVIGVHCTTTRLICGLTTRWCSVEFDWARAHSNANSLSFDMLQFR